MVLEDRVRDDVHSLQDLLKVLEHILISQLKGRDHTRRVLYPRILEAIVLSLLQRLISVAQKASDDPEADPTLLLQSMYPLKKQLDCLELVTRQEVLFSAVIDRETRVRMNIKGRNHIGSIELVDMPIPHRINQFIIKELIFMTLVKLDPIATKNMGVITAGLGFQTEEVTKERKRRRNSKESFTKMNKK
jgi:hypothetical protein